MGSVSVSKKSVIKRRRRRRVKYFLILCVCCIVAFYFGKLAGEAKRAQRTENPYGGKDDLIQADIEKGELSKNNNDVSEGGKYDTECLILVNRENPLPEDYQVELVTLNDGVHKCAKEAYGALCDMLQAGIREGLTFEICSAYRSTKRQKELFDEDLQALMDKGWSYEKAWDEVAKETMPPGCSEHSTGLALDIVAFDYQMLDKGQEDTDENIWLRKHCAEYGFILRYPKGTEDITGISYESWHFRYVGIKAAKIIMEEGITLEEYLQSP